jgi:hypothetical protein
MMKKTALAASITVALAGVSLPASSAILGTAAEGLLVPVFTHGYYLLQDTEVQVTTPANIGFDGVPNSFTALNTTPTSAGPALNAVYGAYVDGSGNGKPQSLSWFWFNEYSDKEYDGTAKVTPDDITTLRASELVPGVDGTLGYLVVTTTTATSGKAAPFSMFGRAWVEIQHPSDGGDTDTVEIPVLGLTDGADEGLTMPTKKDNIKYNSGVPVGVSPLVTGIRTNVSNDTLAARTVFDLEIAAAGQRAAHIIWLDQNRAREDVTFNDACLIPNAPGKISGYIYDSEEKRQSWGDCVPWELTKIFIDTSEELKAYPAISKDGGGFIQYILPEYQDDPALGDGPQAAGFAFALVQKASGDWVMSLANERGMYNDGCGNDPCVPKP